MGISCHILFKNGSHYNPVELYKEMENVCQCNKYYCEILGKRENAEGRTKVIFFNVSDMPFEKSVSRQLAITVLDEPYEDEHSEYIFKVKSFDWYGEEIFFEAMYINFFEDNKDLLLELLYGFMKKYKDAVIWVEDDWFYFYEDIIRIKQAPFNSRWCYQNPHS